VRIILDFMICIAVAPGLYSFQNPAAAASGGTIRGHVLQSKSGEPVKKAVVIVRRGEEPGTGAVTDASGAFQFDNLEAGAYTLSTERAGFILDPESERMVVNIKAGPDNSEVILRLISTGAISGRVLDSDGEPITGATVQVVPLNQKKGGVPPSSAVTNDRGEYRSFNIPPGKYCIAASYEPRFQQMQVKMQRPSTQSSSAPDQLYALTYYPSVLDSKQADTVDVGAGADLQGFDIQILRARGVNVRGAVSVAGGAPVGAIVLVTLSPIRQTIGFRARDNMIQDSSGAFELTEVLPGTYVLDAMTPLNDKKLSARRIIEVGTGNVDAVQLTLAPPQTINGAVIVPEGRKMPVGLIAVLISRESRDNRSGGMSQPGNDGVFQMRDVPPGDYDVALGTTATGDDLYVSAVQMGDDDALADGIHVGGLAVGPLKVILKGGGGTLQASVKDSRGKPRPDSYVKLVPDPPRRAQMALYADCKTDASGMCGLHGVTPGNYHAFAFVEERQIDFRDPAATADIEDSGKAVTIAESARQSIELTPAPGDK
jgi:hypothetical protein